MPHIPDTNHDTHDLELVAAYAAGDAGADAARAETLIASCTDCAALADDLRAIAAALTSVPVPQRPRDFRLTSEQAAALRPRGIRGLLAALSGPKFAFATPLGTGLAALGIVGVLVASGGLPFGTTGSPALSTTSELAAPETQPQAQAPAVGSDGDNAGTGAAGAQSAASAAPSDAAMKNEAALASPEADRITDQAAGSADPAGTLSDGSGTTDAAASSPLDAPLDPLTVGGIVLIFLGGALIGARAVGNRLDRA